MTNPSPANPTSAPTAEAMLDALERIALLDEADGHELTWEHASHAVAIATSTLGKHPSQIHAERQGTADGAVFGRPTQAVGLAQEAIGHRDQQSALQRPAQPTRILKCLECHRVFVDCNQCPVCNAKLSTQSTREQEKKAKNYGPVEWPDKVLRKVYASPGSPMAEEASGAEAVARLLRYADDLDLTERPSPDEYDVTADIRSICTALRSVPVPAPGVTDEMVNAAMLEVQAGCDINPKEMRRGLSAALRPKE